MPCGTRTIPKPLANIENMPIEHRSHKARVMQVPTLNPAQWTCITHAFCNRTWQKKRMTDKHIQILGKP